MHFVSFVSFLTLLSDTSKLSPSHLQLQAHWDKQNVITIKENVRANQWPPLVSQWRGLSTLNPHTDQRGGLQHWWMTHRHFHITITKICSFPEPDKGFHWNSEIKKTTMVQKGAVLIISKTIWKGPFLIMSELLKVKAPWERENNEPERGGWWETWMEWFYGPWPDTIDPDWLSGINYTSRFKG